MELNTADGSLGLDSVDCVCVDAEGWGLVWGAILWLSLVTSLTVVNSRRHQCSSDVLIILLAIFLVAFCVLFSSKNNKSHDNKNGL